MDKSTFRHRLVVAWDDDTRADVFVRSDDGNVEHYWTDPDDGLMAGPEDLGGTFDTDPVLAGGRLIGRSGDRLVEWTWEQPIGLRWLGAPIETVLPGLCATTPVAIATAGQVDVFAPSLNGPMRHWFRLDEEGAWRDPSVLTDDLVDTFREPCVVARGDGGLDLFAIDATGGLFHWFLDDEGWHGERLTQSATGENLTGRPAACWSDRARLDVFAVRGDGVPIHWGFNGAQWFRDEVRLRDDTVPPTLDLELISIRPQQLTLLGGDQAWNLDPTPPGDWRGQGWEGLGAPNAGEGSIQVPDSPDPVRQGRMSTIGRVDDGSFLLRQTILTNRHSIDGFASWETEDDIELELKEPAPPADFTPAVVPPELLARRPEDLVMMGVRWNEQIQVSAGPPAELVAQAGAELSVTLPPQHIAEGVVRESQQHVHTGSQATGDVAVWPSGLSGASRVVVSLTDGARVPLTIEGVLDALRTGTLVPAQNATEPGTQLELPYRLLMTPFRVDNGAIVLDHASQAVTGVGGAVGLWNTRLSAAGAPPTAPAGLTMRPLAADSEQRFDTSLSGGARARILAEKPEARIDRLRLSGLGGSLTASGAWDTYEWDHVAVMGRDLKVRTATKGLLYPWGNPAVFVETSERRFETSEEGAVAHVWKKSVLVVTEPVRDLPLSRAFPFTQVRLERTLAELPADPAFRTKIFPPPAAAFVQQQRDVLVQLADSILTNLYGDGFTPGQESVAEDLAVSPDVDASTAQNSAKLVEMAAAIRRADDTLAALEVVSAPEIDIWVVPTGAGGPISFPAVLGGPSGEIHVDLPVVFVADVRMPHGLTHEAYRSLEDPEILDEVAAAWEQLGDGDVTICPMRIDFVGAAAGRAKPADSPEVRRLHIVGESRDGGFGPRLGVPPADGETVPAAKRWAFEMAMTEVATLVGHEVTGGVPTLTMALSPQLLSGAPDPGLLFRTTGTLTETGELEVQRLTAEFSKNSARSGGLASPDLAIDAVARGKGPGQADTILAQLNDQPLDPERFLGGGATLLGFSLVDLLKQALPKTAPEIWSTPSPGQPPTVTMSWTKVPLKTTQGQLLTKDATVLPGGGTADDGSSLSIDVTLSPQQQTVTCDVRNVVLAFPDRDKAKLLEVGLEQVTFRQQGGGAPTIEVSGDIKPKFFGFLQLLSDLQDAVKLAGAEPSIEASSRGVTARFDLPVPDVTAGAFQLTGLSFHAMIDVPFDERPVTIGLAFASREDPFNVSVLALGGGGYVDIVVDKTGLQRFEMALEFGASLEVDFKVATGEVHAMGGLRVVADPSLSLQGYLRFGGMVEVLGLVSVSVELVVTLTYDADSNSMIGHATMVLEVDLLLFSDSVELDSGDWVLAGDAPSSTAEPQSGPPMFLAARGNAVDPFLGLGRIEGPAVDPGTWSAYRAAFDEEALAQKAPA